MPGIFGKPLISQKTDLKSLKYTFVNDSGETVGKGPYVTKRIPDHDFEQTAPGFYEGTQDPLPFPKASGILGARADDLKRLSKAVKDNGVKFATNQAILGLTPKQIALTIGSTLAQAPVNGTGTHFIHGFVKNSYLTQGVPEGKNPLTRFLIKTLGVDNMNSAGKKALSGATIIPDNTGEQGYKPIIESLFYDPISDKAKLNSKFDLTPGADKEETLDALDRLRQNPYIDTAVNLGTKAYNLAKGFFSKNKTDKQANKPLKLGNIFKLNPDNLGNDGYRPLSPSQLGGEGEEFNQDEIQSELKGPSTPATHLATGASSVDGRSIIKGGNSKVSSDNTGGRGFTPNTPDFLSEKESEQTINVDGTELPLKPTFPIEDNPEALFDSPSSIPINDGNDREAFNTSEYHAEGTKLAESLKTTPDAPSTSGRIMPQIGPDGFAEGTFRTFVDEEGVTGVIERDYDPNNPSQLKMYLQDQSNIQESEDLKTELGGQVSSGNTNTNRVTKLIDFRKIRKWGVNAGVHGKTESIGPDSNGYTSTTHQDLLPDYTTDEVGVRLQYATKGVADFINFSPVIEADNTDELAVAEEATWKYYNGDIIPFVFNTLTPDGQKFIFFRAFLDDLSDNYSGNWEGNQYVGRAEEFYTYQGFKRDVSFSFKVAAFTKQELIPLYKKLNHLAASTAPTYGKNGNFMRGTLTTLSIGEYLDRQDGFVSKVDLSWEKGYPWEIDLFNEKLPKVPTILNVSISFTPIHNFEAKNDIDLENKNESYFGAQYGAQRRPVETANTLTPKPAIQPRPQAEIPKIPTPETTNVSTPVAQSTETTTTRQTISTANNSRGKVSTVNSITPKGAVDATQNLSMNIDRWVQTSKEKSGPDQFGNFKYTVKGKISGYEQEGTFTSGLNFFSATLGAQADAMKKIKGGKPSAPVFTGGD